jgi:hypothetical protein
MDPIEDFLTNQARHCEYLPLPSRHLRHVGPARMVVGFKCDEWHEAEQCYQVRQLHAHTWVRTCDPSLPKISAGRLLGLEKDGG